MSGRERWKLILILLRFIREADDTQLLDVAQYAAQRMMEEVV